MKTFKTILIYFLSAFVILSLLLYLVLIFIVPEYLEDNICSVTGICTETENLKIEITPALRVKLDADIVKSGDSIYVEKIHASADIKKLAVQSINADYIFIDGNKFAHKKSSFVRCRTREEAIFCRMGTTPHPPLHTIMQQWDAKPAPRTFPSLRPATTPRWSGTSGPSPTRRSLLCENNFNYT